MKYTPGPWEITRPYRGRSKKPSPYLNIRSFKHDASGFGREICHIKGRWNLKHGDESGNEIDQMQEGDAKLIAAAPEMYEALRRVIECGIDNNGNVRWALLTDAKELLERIDL